MTLHLDAVPRLWATRTPQRGTAAGATETKTDSPLEKVPRRAWRGEVERSACRPADKTARPIRFGHSVDITRCGDVRVRTRAPVRTAPLSPGSRTSRAFRLSKTSH
ncbi:uncharacterized protein Tco025E_09214 [Trypanosoma conorhini]|uniref:Uncharacterized protein n=1 Tax=Trypanosoma conorhini TaxID=83891 RepID=A0A3R7MC76_9TRYP|nr:uncharacterized protein Tco025E_09214 [Trypanosoma conorhini]RNE99902.1 hypothetical protein Tco025E_09214 [Trypanosoma conorhini]